MDILSRVKQFLSQPRVGSQVFRIPQQVNDYKKTIVQRPLQTHLTNFVKKNPNFIASRLTSPLMPTPGDLPTIFSQQKFQFPRIDLVNKVNFENPTRNKIVKFGVSLPEQVINAPSDYQRGIANINRGNLLQGVGQAGMGAVNIGTLGGGSIGLGIGKGVVKQAGIPALKTAIKQGAAVGSLYGGGYGALSGLASSNDKKKQLKEVAIQGGSGVLLGGLLGGTIGGVGNRIGAFKSAKVTSNDAPYLGQLRDAQGRWAKGQAPVKPKGMPTAQWKYQLQFNKKYGRNPYEPVFSSDLDKAIKFELENSGGLSIKDINKTPFTQDVSGLGVNTQRTRLKGSPTLPEIVPGVGRTNQKIPSGQIPQSKTPSINNIAQKLDEELNGKSAQAGLYDTLLHKEALKYKTTDDFIKNQPLAYHGSPKPLKQFHNKNGVFFTDNMPDASGFAGTPDNVYEGFLNFKKPLVIDAKGAKWDALNTKYGKSTQEIVGNAEKKGFDGVVFKNLVDNIGDTAGYGGESTISYAIKPRDAFINESQLRQIFKESRVAQQPIADVAKAKLSSKAIAEGITEPRKGSDISVPTQQGIKARVKAKNTLQVPSQSEAQLQPGPLSPQTYRANSYKQPVESLGLGKVRPKQDQLAQGQASQAQKVDSLDDIVRSSDIKVKSKVNFLDYLRTPDRVLQKMGLGKEAVLVRQKYNDYLDQLPKEIDTITQWSNQVPKQENQALFKYLDGQTDISTLSPQTQKVALEIREYLKDWAVKLGLPEDKRITNYITHIFDKDFIQKEFDPEIAAMIRDKVPGSVYDPFVQQRLGKAGYVEDTWRALDAYVKRATRKYNMDEALEQISARADGLEDSQFNYVKKYVDKINMRPGQLDSLIDNFIKSTPIGYRWGQRPLASTSRAVRQWVYRGTLGLNVGSALRNLTQGANTYAQLGEKYTAAGYYKLIKSVMAGDDELKRVGVLRDNFIQDKTLSATGKAWEKLDKGLWVFFNAAEKINRGAAYYGAKSRALAKGASEEDAVKAGIEMVRKTQFTFGSVDTPQALQSDLAKTLLQFQSYNLKQAEFLIEMAKNKEFAGLARYSVASAALLVSIGELIGMKPTDFIPFYGSLTGTSKIGNTPPVQLVKDLGATVVGAKDEYGNQPDAKDRLDTFANDMIPFIPGGVQIKKTVDFLQDNAKGYDASRTGRVKYPIQQTPDRFIRGVLFGSNNLPEGQEYYNEKRSVLSENQTEAFKNSSDPQGLYNQIMTARQGAKESDEVKKQIEEQGGQGVVDGKIYYNDNGEVKTFNTKPDTSGTGIGALANTDWTANQAAKLHRLEGINDATKNEIYKMWGYTPEEARYADLASYNNDVSTQWILSKSNNHQELLRNIITGRKKSITGQQFITDSIINDLRDEGHLSKVEASLLKKIEDFKNGKPDFGANKATAGRKVKVGKATTPKSAKIKLQKPKFGKVALGKPKSTKKKAKVKGNTNYEKELAQIARSTGAKV